MSLSRGRVARIETHEAKTECHEKTDDEGNVRTDRPKASARPRFLRLVASKGATLASSEVHSTRANARTAISAWKDASVKVLDVPAGQARPHRDMLTREFDAEGEQTQ
jgi:uncharacterized protein YegP (UPF0339 family)